MKIRSSQLILFFLLFIVIINLHILDFKDISSLFRYITAFMAIIMATACVGNKYIFRTIKPYIKFLNKFVLIFFGYYAIETIYGLVYGDIGWLNYVTRLLPFTYIFLSYPIIFILQDNKGAYRFLRWIIILATGSLIQKIFVWWEYNYCGQDIMHYVLYEMGDIWQRNGLLRIPATCLNAFYIATCVAFIYSRKLQNKIWGIFFIFLLTWYANFVMQSRALIITIGISVILAYVLYRDIDWRKSVMIIIIALIAAVFFQSEYFSNMLIGLGLETYSTSIRLQGFNYYLTKIKRHWLLGLIPFNTYESIRADNWRFYLSDLGMFSLLFEYGIIGFVIFNIPIIRAILVYIRSKEKDLYLLSAILATILFSYMSNNIYFINNILALPILIAYVEVYNKGKIPFNNHNPKGNNLKSGGIDIDQIYCKT